MKSICIKTLNQNVIEYLLEKLNNSNLENIYFSCRKFKIYNNIIVHYIGKNENDFLEEMSKLLSYLIVDLFQETIINKLISYEYFYFDSLEKQQIVNYTLEDLFDTQESVYPKNKTFNLLCNNFYQYLLFNHSIFLNGFITFRIKNYLEIILEQIDKSVNRLLIEHEYTEFISILKLYINSEPPTCNVVHLIYNNIKSTLLDENKNIINIDTDLFNAKYLSDISFSSNDYALNTLLNLVPKKIYVHLIDNNVDEFINTLKLIFENRIIYCTDCSICNLYKNNSIQNTTSFKPLL